MSLSLGLGLPPAPKKGGADALHGVQVQAARSPGRTFFRNGLRRSTALTDVATVTRATQAWGVDQGGNVASFAAGQPVVTTAGLAVYEARTNSIRNPTGLGAAAGTPGTLPTNWNFPSPVSGINRQVVGFGVQNGLPYIDVRYFGTATASGFVSPAFDGVGVIAATVGQTWTHRTFLALVAGSMSGITTSALRVAQYNSANVYLKEISGTPPNLMGLNSTLTPFVCTGVADAASVAWVLPYFQISWNNGAVIDATFRIAAPNLKLGADIADPPILQTNNAAATRNADVVVGAVNIPVGQAFTVTGKWVVAAALSVYPTLFSLDDGSGASPQNLMSLYVHGDTRPRVQCISAGATVDTNTNVAIAGGSVLGMAVSVSGSQVTYSVNGSVAASFTMPGGAFAAALLRAGLGCYAPTSAARLDGTVRALNIVMRAYSSAELQAASDVTLTHDLDFVSQVYQYVGAPYVTPTDLPGTTFSRASEALNDDGSGQWFAFASGALRVTSGGCYFGESTTNKCTNFNAAPDAAAVRIALTQGTLTRVDDTAALRAAGFGALIDAGRLSGQVWKADNSAFGTISYLTVDGATGNTNTHWNSAFVRGGSGAIRSTAGSGAGRLAFSSSAGYRRLGVAIAPTNSSITAQYEIDAGQVVYFILNQLEEKTYATPPVIVAGASATRNADVLASTNDSNPSAYTVVAEFTVPPSGSQNGRIWGYDDGTANNRALLYIAAGSNVLQLVVTTAGVEVARISLGAVTPGTSYKVAAALASNDFAAVITGGSVQTDVSGAVPPCTRFGYGCQPAAGSQFGGVIKRIRRFSTRKTNAELQALVA